MDTKLQSVATPQRMLDPFTAIDALDMSPTSGFAVFDDDIEMVFCDKVIKGIAAAKQFFVAFYTPQMKTSTFPGRAMAALLVAGGAAVSAPSLAQSAQAGGEAQKWEFAATIYGFLPIITTTVNYPGDLGSSETRLSMHDVLSSLKMAFFASLDAHNGTWGIFNDVVYADLGGARSQTRDFSIGNIDIPASATTDLSADFKATLWTVAGEYRVLSDLDWKVDLLAGARLLNAKPSLGYSISGDIGPIVLPGRSGRKEVSESYWDGIVGVKGRYAFGDERKWFAPFYADVGTGQTKLTWQLAAGVGYVFSWGEAMAMWRYIDYTNNSGKPIEGMTMNGIMGGVTFRF